MSIENKTLPTEPGWYAQADEPLTSDSTVCRLDDDGEWLFEQWAITAEQMLRLAPLARLDMKTDTAQHPEVDIAAAREAFAATYSNSIDDPDDDFEAVLLRVLNGEFNK